MQSLILGSVLSLGILGWAFVHSRTGLQTFLNLEGIFIVLGGTFAIWLMSTRKRQLYLDLRELQEVLRARSSLGETKRILLECAQQMERSRIPRETPHPFLNRALGWLGAGLKGSSLEKLLVDGARLEIERTRKVGESLASLSKYPPALGMVGTVFGIIAIFQSLGDAAGQANLGKNLAFAMTATLYGLITTNFILSPIAELIDKVADQKELELSLIVETVKLWSERENPLLVRENIELYDAA